MFAHVKMEGDQTFTCFQLFIHVRIDLYFCLWTLVYSYLVLNIAVRLSVQTIDAGGMIMLVFLDVVCDLQV